MLQIAICDDIAEHAERLEAMIHQTGVVPGCQVERYLNAQTLIDRISAPFHFDILFLDIELIGDSGVQVAKVVNSLSPDTQIVFVSAYLSLAVDIFDAAHIYFLMKPVIPVRLKSALERAVGNIRSSAEKQLLLPIRGNASIVFNVNDIIYFERIRRITIIRSKTDSSETSLKLDMLESMLPEGLFSRPHNSYLVNLMQIKKMERFCLHLSTGEMLPISNQRRPTFKQDLAAFIEL